MRPDEMKTAWEAAAARPMATEMASARDALVSVRTALATFRATVTERRGSDVLAAQEPIEV